MKYFISNFLGYNSLFYKRHFLSFQLPEKSLSYITEFCCVVEFLIGFPRLDPAVGNEVRSQKSEARKADVNVHADLEAAPQLSLLSGVDAVRADMSSIGQDGGDPTSSTTLPFPSYNIPLFSLLLRKYNCLYLGQ